MIVFSGTSNKKLARLVAKRLNRRLSRLEITRYEDGEFNIRVLENVNGKECAIVQAVSNPVHDNFFELVLIADALYASGARVVTALIPYLGYSRQDTKSIEGRGVAGRLIAEYLSTRGIDRAVIVDIHSVLLLKHFSIPVQNIEPVDFMLQKVPKKKYVVVAPDFGAVHRASHAARILKSEVAIVEKSRHAKSGKITSRRLTGEVYGRDVLIVDDMITTGATAVAAARLAKDAGAKSITALVTHGVLSPGAAAAINRSPISKVFFSNTLPVQKNAKFRSIDISPLIAKLLS